MGDQVGGAVPVDGVDRVADELDVRSLLARVAQLADGEGPLHDYLECFTEDAVWEFPGNPRLGLDPARTVGRAAIAVDRESRREDRFQGPGTGSRHLSTTVSVTVSHDGTASAVSHWLYAAAGARDTTGALAVPTMGRYDDRFARDAGGRWRITYRRITVG